MEELFATFLQNKWFIEQLIPDVDSASGLSMNVV